MRAGTLDRTITLQSLSYEVDDYGNPVETWTDGATLRAQLVQASTDEFLAAYGETDRTVMIFRTRWQDGVTPTLRVRYGDRLLNIREVKEIGRRRGLELRCEEPRS